MHTDKYLDFSSYKFEIECRKVIFFESLTLATEADLHKL